MFKTTFRLSAAVAVLFTSVVNWTIERIAYRPLRGSMACERAHERGLAHAVVPEHPDEFALRHAQVDPHQDRDATVAGLQPLHL